MIGIARSPQLPNKTQQYCQLVKRSIDRVNSLSKNSPSPVAQTKVLSKPPEIKKSSTYQRLRQRIRSRSNSNRQSVQKSRSLSRCQKTNLNSNNQSYTCKQGEPLGRKISNYEQQHLIGSMQRENAQLKEAIKQAEAKAEKMRAKIEEQRNSQHIQREMYEQQVKKLKQTLEMQMKSRSKPAQSEEQCSIDENVNSEISQKRV